MANFLMQGQHTAVVDLKKELEKLEKEKDKGIAEQ